MTRALRDLRHALRSLRRHPGFAGGAVLTLALGVAGVTVFFSLVYGILLRPLSYPEPDRLLYFHWQTEEGTAHVGSAAKYLHWHRNSRAFDSITAFEVLSSGATLVGGTEPEYVQVLRVSGDFFDTLGVSPFLGRGFTPDEDQPGGPAALLLSHELWTRTFGRDRSVLGRGVRVGEEAYEVVGVLPPGFSFRPPAEVWVPLKAQADSGGGANLFGMLGRLAPGVEPSRAQLEADTLFESFQDESPYAVPEEVGVWLGDYREHLVGEVRGDLWLLFGAGALIFFICCVNLSQFVLARSFFQAGETATRIALGARRGDLLRRTVAEYFWVGVLAAGLGWVLARALLPVILVLGPEDLPRLPEVRIGAAEGIFAGLVALLGATLVALVATLRVGAGDLSRWLRLLSVGGGVAAGVRGRAFGRVLVVGQVMVSLVVLAVALGLIQVFFELSSRDPGFVVERVLTFQVPLQAERYQTTRPTWRFAEEVVRNLHRNSRVDGAAAVTALPLEIGLNVPLHVEGYTDAAGVEIELRAASSEFFSSLGIPLLHGRGLTARDDPETEPVVVVNQTLAERFWGLGSAVDQTLWIAKDLGPLSDRPRRVVGVVDDIRDEKLNAPSRPTAYIPLAQIPDGITAILNQTFPLSFVVRLGGGAVSIRELGEAVRQADSRQAVAYVRPLAEVVSSSMIRERFQAALLGLFGILAAVLTALGIYSVLSSHVGLRTHEIGVRMAVGAHSRDVLRLFLVESLKLTSLGVVLAIPLSLGLNAYLGSLVEDVSVSPTTAMVLGTGLLLVLALVASLAPARRASRIDPQVVLRAG